MIKVIKEFIVENENGLHARPSASFVKIANEFQSHIEIINENGDFANGKSILGIMCLCASNGDKLKVIAEGHDANDAIFALENLFKNKFENVT